MECIEWNEMDRYTNVSECIDGMYGMDRYTNVSECIDGMYGMD
jgi:hypothetical protein